jgi:hypothetical protein
VFENTSKGSLAIIILTRSFWLWQNNYLISVGVQNVVANFAIVCLRDTVFDLFILDSCYNRIYFYDCRAGELNPFPLYKTP